MMQFDEQTQSALHDEYERRLQAKLSDLREAYEAATLPILRELEWLKTRKDQPTIFTDGGNSAH